MSALNGSAFAHHLSREGKERLSNPMKHISRRVALAGPSMISMANGEPQPRLFPVTGVQVHVPLPNTNHSPKSSLFETPKTQILDLQNDGGSAIDLAQALQYHSGWGLSKTVEIVQELNRLVHRPHHNNIILTVGNVDAAVKVFRLFGERGDTMLCEEFTFPGTLNAPHGMGIRWAPLRIDANGIIPEEMEQLLHSWDETKRGKKPRLLYTIPAGQNPTGSTLTVERRQKIYKIARKHDLLILEDDPYYFLQYKDGSPASEAPADFINSLAPTFLSMDVEGRVLRIDTLSKTLVPGLRLGWITCNEFFAEKLLHMVDSSTQAPNGLSQSLFCELLTSGRGWGIDGYLTWCIGLRNEYQRRRDLFFKGLQEHVLSTGYASTYVPEAGMFFWIEVHVHKHPRWSAKDAEKDEDARANLLTQQLTDFAFERGLAVMPAAPFSIGPEYRVHDGFDITPDMYPKRMNHLRATFAGEDDVIERGLKLMGQVLSEFFLQ
ncbi:L-tyrosine:2-oxoglutarate aminotransferase [Auriculariales sp. MPI-PUGE-AT-0066]|nr:L-tyrosine:2-oxoglutarate aminotransferase [Auriculariales sp. MPI-PUGE-AT-0066]